jgi:ferredoxin
MKRQIIHIDQDKCTGCGLCAQACHEGAIGMVNGKATLLRDDYCDGMGDCLPSCPAGAITFTQKDTAAYDEKAVAEHKAQYAGGGENVQDAVPVASQLRQWPVQIKLVPVNAPYFDGANLLVAADCTAYAYGNFHNEFIKNRITLIGCPKLDEEDYTEKLSAIIAENNIKSLTVVRMEVPCCGGLERAAVTALQNSGKFIPWRVVTISTDGQILDE